MDCIDSCRSVCRSFSFVYLGLAFWIPSTLAIGQQLSFLRVSPVVTSQERNELNYFDIVEDEFDGNEGTWGLQCHLDLLGKDERWKGVQSGLRFDVRWDEIALDPLGNNVSIRGQICSQGSELKDPIFYSVPLTIALARQPDTAVQWHSGDQVNYDLAIVRTDGQGKFLAIFDARSLAWDAKEARSFEVLAIPGEHLLIEKVRESDDSQEGSTEMAQCMTWSSQQSPLESSRSRKVIGPIEALSNGVRCLNRACNGGGDTYHPAEIVQGVNCLIALGKEDALKELKTFMELYDQSAWKDDGDLEIIHLILRLAFEPLSLHDPLHTPGELGLYRLENRLGSDEWPLDRYVLFDEIPWVIKEVRRTWSCGLVPITSKQDMMIAHVEYVQSQCVIRETPLRPGRSPLEVAEQLLTSQVMIGLTEEDLDQEIKKSIRKQAISMLPDAWRREIELVGDLEWHGLVSDLRSDRLIWSDDQGFLLKD